MNSKWVAHFGTFDVDNFGDLLFPKIAEWRLPALEVRHFSPTNSRPRFADAAPPDAVSLSTSTAFDGCGASIIGGGNIVHFRKTALGHYSDLSGTAYPSLSLLPTDLAIRFRLPLIINAPSIATPTLNPIEKHLLRRVLKAASYATFRDMNSVLIAKQSTSQDVQLVPDTAFDVAKMWPFQKPLRPKGYVVVHVNDRYGGPAHLVAQSLEEMVGRHNVNVVLLPIGPCHGDVRYAEEIRSLCSVKVDVFDDFRLKKFAELIAEADGYIGSSMHGFILAQSYGVAGRLVLGPAIKAKFLGVIQLCGLPMSVISQRWGSQDVIDLKLLTAPQSAMVGAFSALDAHWDRVENAIHEPAKVSGRTAISLAMTAAKVSQMANGVYSLFQRSANKGRKTERTELE